jgi:hypothetical protein
METCLFSNGKLASQLVTGAFGAHISPAWDLTNLERAPNRSNDGRFEAFCDRN